MGHSEPMDSSVFLRQLLDGELAAWDHAIQRSKAFLPDCIEQLVRRTGGPECGHISGRPSDVDIREMGRLVEMTAEDTKSSSPQRNVTTNLVLGAYMVGLPELILPLGYNNIRFAQPMRPTEEAAEVIPYLFMSDVLFRSGGAAIGCSACSQFRRTAVFETVQFEKPGGAWLPLADVLLGEAPSSELIENIGSGSLRIWERWQSKLEHNERKAVSSMMSFPALWHSGQPTLLHASVETIVEQLYKNETHLSQIGWRTLEELIGELLREKGMRVTLTPPSHDGGRDLIAEGELIPGQPVRMALEVKQTATVDLSDVSHHLYRNREFPLLLVATSGRFSAGVLQEQARPENFLRLILKDGPSLSQWIDEYAARRGWTTGLESS